MFKFRGEDSDVFRFYRTGIGGIIILLKLQVTRPQRQTGLHRALQGHQIHLIYRFCEYP